MRRLSNARGAMLIQVGISIMVLMGLTVFVFDNGLLWVARNQAQNAADAGTLAGAQELDNAHSDILNQVDRRVSNTLGLSIGPVHDPAGRQIGTCTSVWRREADGSWRVAGEGSVTLYGPADGASTSYGPDSVVDGIPPS